eukprot:TRINITY_DN5744_c0_g1_i1.p1 TRINITY_DN5744_c0_g1~~TRINITY_DN5744_c0_g1_i1.p1  ORF type:complete len:1690 (-),score=479.35 TRINITY_DN5744_c0_g1_i1:56-4975(-)
MEDKEAMRTQYEQEITDLKLSRTRYESQVKDGNTYQQELIQEKEKSRQLNVTIQNLEEENRSRLIIITKRGEQLESLNQDLNQSNERVKQLTEAELELKKKNSDIEKALIELEFSKNQVINENTVVHKHNGWLEEQLNEKMELCVKLQKEKSTEVFDLQQRLSQSVDHNKNLELELEDKKKIIEEKTENISQLLKQVKNKNEELSMKQNNFDEQIGLKEKLILSYKNKSEDLSYEITQLQNKLQSKEAHIDDINATYSKELEKIQEEKVVLLEHQIELQQEVENLKDNMHSLPENIIFSEKNIREKIRELSEVPNKHIELLIVLQQKYELSTHELQNVRNENRRLNGYMNDIYVNLKEKMRIMEEEKKEYERFKEENTRIIDQMNEALRANEKFKLENTLLGEECDKLTQENEDLGRQVATLLQECQILQGKPPSMAITSSPRGSILSAGDIISAELVTFRDIEELQTHNRDLLRALREMSSEMEKQERADVMAQKLTKEMEKIRDSRILLEDKIQGLQQENKALKVMLKKSESQRVQNMVEIPNSSGHKNAEPSNNNTYLELYHSTQEAFERYKSEQKISEQNLRTHLDESNARANSISNELATYQTKLEVMNQRYSNLENELNSQKSQIQSLIQLNNNVSNQLVESNRKLSENSAVIMEKEGEIRVLQSKNIRLESEKVAHDQAEKRLRDEIKDIRNQRDQQHSLVRQLSLNNEDKEEQAIKLRDQLNTEVGMIKEQKESLSLHIERLIDSHESEIREEKLKISNLKIEIEELVQKLNQKDTVVNEANSQLESARVTISNLNSSLTAAEKKVEILLNKAVGGDVGDRAKLENALSEINNLHEQLQTITESRDHYKEIVDNSKETMEEMTSKLAESDSKVQEYISKIEALKSMMASNDEKYNETIESFKEERRDINEKHMDTVKQYQNELSKLKSTYEQSSSVLNNAAEEKEQYVNDLNSLITRLDEANQKYQDQLLETSKAFSEIKELKQELLKSNQTLQETLSNANVLKEENTNLQESFEEKNKSLLDQISEMENRLNELREHNELLYSKLDASKNSNEVEFIPKEGEEKDEKDQIIEELNGILKFLRHDNHILKTDKSLLEKDLVYTKKQSEQFLRARDEAINQLKLEQEKHKHDIGNYELYQKREQDIEQLSILNESNHTLREQYMSSLKQIEKLENEIVELRERMIPMNEEKINLENKLDVAIAQTKVVQDQRDQLRERVDRLLERYKSIDPEVHEKLKQDKEMLENEHNTLQAQFTQLQEVIKFKDEQIVENHSNVKVLSAKFLKFKNDTIAKEKGMLDLSNDIAEKEKLIQRLKYALQKRMNKQRGMEKEITQLKQALENSNTNPTNNETAVETGEKGIKRALEEDIAPPAKRRHIEDIEDTIIDDQQKMDVEKEKSETTDLEKLTCAKIREYQPKIQQVKIWNADAEPFIPNIKINQEDKTGGEEESTPMNEDNLSEEEAVEAPQESPQVEEDKEILPSTPDLEETVLEEVESPTPDVVEETIAGVQEPEVQFETVSAPENLPPTPQTSEPRKLRRDKLTKLLSTPEPAAPIIPAQKPEVPPEPTKAPNPPTFKERLDGMKYRKLTAMCKKYNIGIEASTNKVGMIQQLLKHYLMNRSEFATDPDKFFST